MLLIYHFTARMSMKIYKVFCTIIHFLLLFMQRSAPEHINVCPVGNPRGTQSVGKYIHTFLPRFSFWYYLKCKGQGKEEGTYPNTGPEQSRKIVCIKIPPHGISVFIQNGASASEYIYQKL